MKKLDIVESKSGKLTPRMAQVLIDPTKDNRFAICPFDISAANGLLPSYSWEFIKDAKTAEEEMSCSEAQRPYASNSAESMALSK